MSTEYTGPHTRQNAELLRRYCFKNGIIVEVSWHKLWNCDYVEVFYPPRDFTKVYIRQEGTLRQMFQRIRVDIARVLNPGVARVLDRLGGEDSMGRLRMFYTEETLAEWERRFAAFGVMPYKGLGEK